MSKKMKWRLINGVALLLLSGSASADLSATVTLEFLDCSCEVRSRHTLWVDDWDPIDEALNARVSTMKCFLAFCYSQVNTKSIGDLDESDEIFDGTRWGVVSAKAALSTYQVNQNYCAESQNSSYATYFLRDNDDSPPSTTNVNVSDCDEPPTGGEGNCSVGTP